MGQSNVSSVVLSIVASFSSGLDVFDQFKKERGRRRRLRSKEGQDVDELRLVRSLRRGPEDIGREYQKGIQVAGNTFVVGDAIAHATLAEVLLRLNTGLVNIICSFLKRDNQSLQPDCKPLTLLAEQSRIDTCRALRHLARRMSDLHRKPFSSSTPALVRIDSGSEDKEQSQSQLPVAAKPPKLTGPTLARVVVQGSSKPSQLMLVKPADRQKKSKSYSSLSTARAASEGAKTGSTESSSPPPYDFDELRPKPLRLASTGSQTTPETVHPPRKQSLANLRAPPPRKPDTLRATKSAPKLPRVYDVDQHMPPPLPALPTREELEALKRRKPASTYHSASSDRTKLGEIPMQEWPRAVDLDAMSIANKEAVRNGWPLNQVGPEDGMKKKSGIFRWFRKKDAVA